ncbi:MAG: nucleoside triphosphate pyrophosphohydrolase [Chloroflexi bacterium]|nr:nucleoside triphosphate pyrophosphohydrolase [Chloroflexota bacterium]
MSSFDNFRDLIARLRAPDGCPWDKEQTHLSLKPYLTEETYEVIVIKSIDSGDAEKLCDELGDLLLQILFHAQIASETGKFNMDDVIRSISEKIIRRHPHVFGNAIAKDSSQVRANWEDIKKGEKNREKSLLASIPTNIPALAYSQIAQDRAARTGFDWKNFEGILDKLEEEVKELKEAKTQQEKVHEFGDLLFVLTNVARWIEIDAEGALRDANQRFNNRFTYMETKSSEKGVGLNKLTFEEQNMLWDEAKKVEKENRGERT